MSLGPGTLIGSNVRLVRLLGQGGKGSIWVAEHLTLHTQVAVKFMTAEVAKNPDATARFTREASAAAQIKSPHVVQTFDHGITEGGVPYIVMELLEGEDLSRRIQHRGRVAPQEVALIVGQVSKALYRAHSLGIVHRDIKPENIFLTDVDGDLLVKVLDFGIAKRSQDAGFSMTSTGAMVGTPYYMSPEQVMSAKSVDFRSDLWSLAVVAYHALMGKVPFEAETVGALCVAINAAEFVPPTKLDPRLPPSVDAWFRKALARDPAQRFPTAKDLGRTLERAVLGVDPSDVPVAEPSLVDSMPGRPTAPAISVSAPMSVPMGTLMEASVTHGAKPSGRGLLFGAVALGSLLVVAVGGFALFKLSSNPLDPPPITAVEAPPAAPAPKPPEAMPADSASPTATPALPSAEPPEPPEKVAETAKPATTRRQAAPSKPTETKATSAGAKPSKPAETKPAKPPDKYGF
jgi:serine/threonine-protein kinase